jgi:putative tricarboxylic transport membrane protein
MIKKKYLEGFIWLSLSIFLGIKSIQLDLGTFQSPGPGFMPFMVALFLFSLSLILILQITLSGREEVAQKLGFRVSALCIICYIVAYVFLFRKIGYLFSTFLLMIFVFKSMGIKRWVGTLSAALLVTLLSYLFFGLILNLNLPAGFF